MIALAQPDWSVIASILAASFGYALFWQGIKNFPLSKRFYTAFAWMGLIQAIQVNWILSDEYVGPIIWVALIFISAWVAFQWGILCRFIDRSPWVVAAIWAIIEWSRIFFLCGYAFNPVGFSLTATHYGSQVICFVGVYGLSFLVIATNMHFYHQKKRALAFALFPYLLGAPLYHWHQNQIKEAPTHEVVLLQQAVEPEKVSYLQWEKFCSLLAPYYGQALDLIIFPEAAVPFVAEEEVYHRSWIDGMFAHFFQGQTSGLTKDKVSNVDIANAISQIFKATVVIGLENDSHNAAFSLGSGEQMEYHKQILLPFGEYIPLGFKRFSWLSIPGGGFEKGRKDALLGEDLGISICYEEVFGNLMRKSRLLGAKLLVNISNDVWYPRSRLPVVHYMHGRLRAIEMGLPLVRACNTGVTCGVDASGKLLDYLPYENKRAKAEPGILKVSIPLYSYPTLYTYLGDYLTLGIASLLLLIYGYKIRQEAGLVKKEEDWLQ